MEVYIKKDGNFVQLQDTTGMYYQKNGSFQKERDDNTIGICVHQDYKEGIRKVALLLEDKGTWDECKALCEQTSSAHMPTKEEMSLIFPFVCNKKIPNHTYWTEDEFNLQIAWIFHLSVDKTFFVCDFCYKERIYNVLPFIDIQIKMEKSIEDFSDTTKTKINRHMKRLLKVFLSINPAILSLLAGFCFGIRCFVSGGLLIIAAFYALWLNFVSQR